MPAYVVFADKTLLDMVRLKPKTMFTMGAVYGVGEAKLRQYGEVFLDVIRQHAAGGLHNPAIQSDGRTRPLYRHFAMSHRIPRYVSNAAIFAGLRCLQIPKSLAESQGLDPKGLRRVPAPVAAVAEQLQSTRREHT